MARLVLSRKTNEKIRLADEIEITILRVSGDRVRLGVSAPSDVLVLRKELATGSAQSTKSPPANP